MARLGSRQAGVGCARSAVSRRWQIDQTLAGRVPPGRHPRRTPRSNILILLSPFGFAARGQHLSRPLARSTDLRERPLALQAVSRPGVGRTGLRSCSHAGWPIP